MAASVGPYTFATMQGRLQAASSPTIPTMRGVKIGSRRPVVQPLATAEEAATCVDAWVQAARYRAAIGQVTAVTDDGGVVCPVALICDVRCRVQAAVGAFTLETVWSVLPSLGYGDHAAALNYVPVDAQGVSSLTAPAAFAASSTAITIGGLSFTTATGDLQWPVTEAQLTAVSNGACAIGGAGASARPETGGGRMECTVAVADEAAGFALMAAVRALVGTFVDVALGGVTISGVAVADAAVSWDTTVVLPNGGTRLAVVSFSFDTQDATGVGGPAAEVQVATIWGNWQTVPRAWCEEAGEGLAGSTGLVSWTQDVCRVLRNGRVYTDEPVDYGGKWVRIRARTAPDGSASSAGTTMTPLWWGEVLRDRVSGGRGQGATRLATCGGLIGAMAKCWPTRWYEQAQDGLTTSNPGEVLPFNKTPGGDGGGVGSNPDVNGYTIHDRYRTDADGNPRPVGWTARQLVDTWLAAFSAQYPQGPRPTLTGQVTALDYVSAWDLTLKDYGNGLIEVVAVRWGLALRVEVNAASEVSLRVSTCVRADTTIPGLGTLPANDRQAAVDLTGSDVVSYELSRAYETQVDHLIVWAGHPWYCMTYRIATTGTRSTQLEKGWTAAEEAAWEAANAEQRGSPALAHVWRRWRLKRDYTGGHAFNDALNVLMKMDYDTLGSAASPHAQHGAGGYSGGYVSGATPRPRSSTIRFTRELPIWTAKDWAAITGTETVDTATTPGRQHEGPILIGVSAAGTYTLMSNRWQIQVEDDAPGIVLGHGAKQAAEVKTYLAGGNHLLLTIGVRYPLPWLMSWRRPYSQRPRDLERCLVLPYPQLVHRFIPSGTVLGLDSSSALKQSTVNVRLDWETTLNSGISKLAPLLALARLRYEKPQRSLTWTRRGIIDTSTATAPGSFVTDALVPLDGNRAWPETIDLVYTGRTPRFVAGEIATSYTCEQLIPSRDKALLAAPVPLRVLGKQVAYTLGGR